MSVEDSTPAVTGASREVLEDAANAYVETSIERLFDSKDECQEHATSMDLELLSTGLGRDVYGLPDRFHTGERACVVKVPTRLIEEQENQPEANYWRELSAEVREFLAPVYDHDVGWLLMPRAEGELTSAETFDL